MRVFRESTYLTRRQFGDELYRRRMVAIARQTGKASGFRGRVQFAWREAPHAGLLVAIRVWA